MGFTVEFSFVHDADAQGHERLGEVDHLLSLGGYGQPCHSQVSFLERDKHNHLQIHSKIWSSTVMFQARLQFG